MRLLLDEMYPRRLAEQLRAEGHDVVAVVELPDLVGREDAEVARWAREHGRVVVTENVVDYAPLDVDEHAGLLLVNARRWPRTPSGLPRLLTAPCSWLEARAGGDDSSERGTGLVQWLQEPPRR
ncbi:hypothetical protein SAMN05660642_01742 [Geodermatophilus siccatus]|uniref:DUF5615 domain-containing protein n=1 Tax=Geodermatophilus siccatus TaxID=1137991 RepID=A0A1G9R2T5_9ACTN|nr:DUF5615 family PIN-like protein [Geodermatophilus siccatus]SDM17441.1 hypothetical protein SAMN05660642_01742 [Geodermatophilus siccatus]